MPIAQPMTYCIFNFCVDRSTLVCRKFRIKCIKITFYSAVAYESLSLSCPDLPKIEFFSLYCAYMMS